MQGPGRAAWAICPRRAEGGIIFGSSQVLTIACRIPGRGKEQRSRPTNRPARSRRKR